MDYLAFGLLAGSLIVIASFVVRDALPYLSAIGDDSRLARLSRAGSPWAWGRWCADAGLVLAAAGTLVLLITVAALLAELSDDAGNVVVGSSVAVAIVASVLGAARLWQRFRADEERELRGEALPAYPGADPTVDFSAVVTKPAAAVVMQQHPPLPRDAELPSTEPGDVWDDDLPMWSPSTSERQQSTGATLAEVGPYHEEEVPTIVEPAAWGWSPVADEDAPPRAPLANRGLFSSPLLADIGLSVEEEADDRFRSPLLSDLHDRPLDDVDRADVNLDTGSDLLLDEAPAPVGSSGRLRDEIDDR